MLLLQATDSSASGGSLIAYGALAVSIITPLVALFNAASSRRTKQERSAANTKTESEANAVASGSVLEWRKTDHQALLDEREYSKKTQENLVASQEEVRSLRDRIAECDRRMDAITEDLRQLRSSIAACPGGPVCPLYSIPRRVDPTEPRERGD